MESEGRREVGAAVGVHREGPCDDSALSFGCSDSDTRLWYPTRVLQGVAIGGN